MSDAADMPSSAALEPSPDTSPPSLFPVVGIGASAGGLGAFEAFFSGMPTEAEIGMAFVLVQHLAPDRKSLLSELLRRHTRMIIHEVEDGMAMAPNCAYIIPPNRDLDVHDGVLRLSEPSEPRGRRLPVDVLFRSLAETFGERSIGIVLSGTGSDGTLGVRAIKNAGGMVMAQNPSSTEFDGMPRSAIATGLVDYQLPPAEMPAQLLAYVTHAFGRLGRARPQPDTQRALKKIFALIRAHTGHELSQYKVSTIQRRIERRMAIHQLATLDDYVEVLQQKPAEVDALFRELLIGVTSFFRDPAAFRALEEQGVAKIFANRADEEPVRVWVAGCSTGEEAYSIAILIQEHLEQCGAGNPVQIFATDIDSRAILTARAGLFPASIVADLSPQRLARFFIIEPDGVTYRARKSIRDLLIFSEQDVTLDPPFSKLDLISCRNLLIYFAAELQRRLIPLFHYALKPRGMLFLGSSEGVGEQGELFTAIDRRAKLFQKMQRPADTDTTAWRQLRTLPDADPPPRHPGRMPLVKLPLRDLIEQALLRELPLAAALVHANGDLLYLHGRAGLYLEPPVGEPGVVNLVTMAREGLQLSLGMALRTASETRSLVAYPHLRVKTNGHFTGVNLSVRPLAGAPTMPSDVPMYLVILEETELPPTGDVPVNVASDPRVLALEHELRAKNEALHCANEELRTSSEELRTSNEEMQSINEELQATNEELETSKEELQSVNEELTTVNHELQTKVADLSRANSDMNNLLAGTGIGTVFVDHQLRILRFTPSASVIINLIHSDVGRPIGHIVTNLTNYHALVADLQSVLATLFPVDREVQSGDGHWYLMRIRPYRTVENAFEGAVMTFVEISEMKHIQEGLERANALLHALAPTQGDKGDGHE
jgi:two-component system, chemotaxis family, CheB/CheR fusion protein